MKCVPDTSIIVDGRFIRFIEDNEVNEIIIPEALLGEIEHQANRGKSVGFSGITELKRIRNICHKSGIKLSFCEKRPNTWQISNAKEGEIDKIIRECASEHGATLITGDSIQRSIAEVKGIPVIFLTPQKEIKMRIENFFTPQTMSVHIKAGVGAFAKHGAPGNFNLEKIRDALSSAEVEEIAYDIIERGKIDEKSFIEMDMRGATVVQLREYRIAITRPPFSDAMEITAVRPIVKLSLDDYNISEKLRRRIDERAEGILVSGSPGAGKSTFVQALAEHYSALNRVVKTMEKPRDLILKDEITRYTALEGSMEKTGDVLLLVRPDYTVFDEMRTTDDFKVFTDLRLAGVGMVGVVHATRAVDALQRFIGRVDLGVIPQIVDTIIHIKAGKVEQVLSMSYIVKVPTGMREADLARPVIEIRELRSEQLLYEVYSFGEQIVVVPVQEETVGIYRLAARQIENEINKKFPGIRVSAKITGNASATIFVNRASIPSLIGKNGKNIEQLERKLGVSLNVEELGKAILSERKSIPVKVEIRKKNIRLFAEDLPGHREVNVFAGKEPLFEGVVSADGRINIRKSTVNGKKLMRAVKDGKTIYLVLL